VDANGTGTISGIATFSDFGADKKTVAGPIRRSTYRLMILQGDGAQRLAGDRCLHPSEKHFLAKSTSILWSPFRRVDFLHKR
jgi:hypothetical protein